MTTPVLSIKTANGAPVKGNTRLYTDADLERLETILALTRDLGVNLAGVEIVLNMREKMMEMQLQTQEFVEFVRREWLNRSAESEERIKNALVRVGSPKVAAAKK